MKRNNQNIYRHYSEPISESVYYSSKIPIQKLKANNSLNIFQDLSESNIYKKPGLLKRNDLGWDGVKLSQFVTNKLSQDIEGNHRMLQRFKRQAEEYRKNKKHYHLKKSNNNKNEHSLKRQIFQLPQLEQSKKSMNYEQEIQEEQKVDYAFCRNVGVNTNKQYEIKNLKRLGKLQVKYEKMKDKYEKSRRQLNHFKELQRKQCEEKSKLDKLRQIQGELLFISTKLDQTNHELDMSLQKQRRKSQRKMPNSIKITTSHSNYTDQQQLNPEQQQKRRTVTEQNMGITEEERRRTGLNLLHFQKMPQENKDTPRKYQNPTVVYTVKNKSESRKMTSSKKLDYY